MPAVLFDLDGVLYNGDAIIPGARETVTWFRERRIAHLFVTNTTSRPRTALVAKLERLGIEADTQEILTPPLAASRWLVENTGGNVALFVPEATKQEFQGLALADDDEQSSASAVVMGDLGEAWDFTTLNRAFRLLMAEPRPVLIALGMTRYWRAPDGLRLDTAPFVAALEYATGAEAMVFGKPAAPFFEAALDMVGEEAKGSIMVGDDIRADIEGSQKSGLGAILVRTGKFQEADLDTGIRPSAVIDSIAELPAWWEMNMAM